MQRKGGMGDMWPAPQLSVPSPPAGRCAATFEPTLARSARTLLHHSASVRPYPGVVLVHNECCSDQWIDCD